MKDLCCVFKGICQWMKTREGKCANNTNRYGSSGVAKSATRSPFDMSCMHLSTFLHLARNDHPTTLYRCRLKIAPSGQQCLLAHAAFIMFSCKSPTAHPLYRLTGVYRLLVCFVLHLLWKLHHLKSECKCQRWPTAVQLLARLRQEGLFLFACQLLIIRRYECERGQLLRNWQLHPQDSWGRLRQMGEAEWRISSDWKNVRKSRQFSHLLGTFILPSAFLGSHSWQ